MRTINKTILVLACMFVILAACGTAFGQGAKIGYVNDEVIKENYREWQRAEDQWEIERKAWDDEALAMQTELEEMIDEYDKQKLILSEDKKKEREATIRVKKDALDTFTRTVYGPGGSAERKYMELVSPIQDNLTKAIELVAIENDYDLILTLQSGIGYIKETLDVTDKVLAQLEKLDQ